jgi:L-tyrosine isonitrile desaturase/decarboxylase
VDAAETVAVERSLREVLYDPRHLLAVSWQTGDVVVADNYSLLHGREPFISGTPRHLRRVHVLGSPPFHNPALVRAADR